MPIALLALNISAFAIGTIEFVIVRLLPTIAADLGEQGRGPQGRAVQRVSADRRA